MPKTKLLEGNLRSLHVKFLREIEIQEVFIEKGVVLCFETSDSHTVQTKFRINTERIFGLTLSQKMASGFGAVGYLLKRPNLGSSDIQFRLENRIHEEQIGEKSQGPQKHELSKKKRVDGFETLKVTNHKPTKTPQNHNNPLN